MSNRKADITGEMQADANEETMQYRMQYQKLQEQLQKEYDKKLELKWQEYNKSLDGHKASFKQIEGNLTQQIVDLQTELLAAQDKICALQKIILDARTTIMMPI